MNQYFDKYPRSKKRRDKENLYVLFVDDLSSYYVSFKEIVRIEIDKELYIVFKSVCV